MNGPWLLKLDKETLKKSMKENLKKRDKTDFVIKGM